MKELLFIFTIGEDQTILQHAPDGWDESMIVQERSKKYFGVFRSLSISLKWIDDAAYLLRQEFYNHGLDAQIDVLIKKLNKRTLTYFDAYKGEIDFSTFIDQDTCVEATVIDGGAASLFKLNETTEYEFLHSEAYDHANGEQEVYIFTEPSATEECRTHALRLYQTFQTLVDKMTNGGLTSGKYATKSDFLTSDGIYGINENNKKGYFLVPEGNLKFPSREGTFYGAYSKFNMSFETFFKGVNTIWHMGLGIELIDGKYTFVLEPRSEFFNHVVIENVGDCKKINISVIPEFNFSKIKIGYSYQDYDDPSINELEANTETIYLTPNKTSKEELDLICPFRADGRGIHQIWNTEAVDTFENAPFILHLQNISSVSPPDTYRWKYVAGWVGKRLASTEEWLMNAEISPRHMLGNHRTFIDDCLFNFRTKEVEFLSGKNDQVNNKVTHNLTPPIVWTEEYEGWEIQPPNIFHPLQIELEAPYSVSLAKSIDENPYGFIQFEYNGITMYGWILKMEIKLSGRGSVKYALLSFKENPLTDLIR